RAVLRSTTFRGLQWLSGRPRRIWWRIREAIQQTEGEPPRLASSQAKPRVENHSAPAVTAACGSLRSCLERRGVSAPQPTQTLIRRVGGLEKADRKDAEVVAVLFADFNQCALAMSAAPGLVEGDRFGRRNGEPSPWGDVERRDTAVKVR